MYRHIPYQLVICLLVAAVTILSCEEEVHELYNSELIFPNSLEINIPPYTYTDHGKQYYIFGDSAYFSGTTDTISTTPLIQWQPKEKKLIFVGIFNAPIQTLNSRIANQERLIWAWHSGLSNEANGHVPFNQGIQVIDGKITNIAATSLEPNKNYYLGIWAWNDSGAEIKYSSRPITFYTVQH